MAWGDRIQQLFLSVRPFNVVHSPNICPVNCGTTSTGRETSVYQVILAIHMSGRPALVSDTSPWDLECSSRSNRDTKHKQLNDSGRLPSLPV